MSDLSELFLKISDLQKELEDLEEEQLAIGVKIHLISQELGKLKLYGEPDRKAKKAPSEVKITLNECRNLIGSRVRIVNPSPGEPNIGTILKVGKLYITVDLLNGIRRNRISSNLRLLKDE